MHTPVRCLRRHAPLALAVAAFLGCGDGAESPTQPALEPSPAVTAAAGELAFTLVSTGASRTCGIATNKRGYCWTDERGPVLIPGDHLWLQLSAGGDHVCGLDTSNLAYCWGSNLSGQLGDGTTTSRTDPVPVFGARRYGSIRAGGFHTCAVTLTGDKAYCWGANFEGQTGDSSTANRRERPKLVAGKHAFRQVVTGWTSTCGVTTDDKAYCWGNGSDGQIGDGKTIQRNWPRAVSGGLGFRVISVGSTGTCAITTANKAYCWGRNENGQVGDGTTTPRLTPVPVSGGRQYRLISRGGSHTCATTTDDKAFCWGDNSDGALGDGTRTDRLVPRAVAGGIAFNGVSVEIISEGLSFTCGRTPANHAYCWGSNFFGQLGDGTTTDRLTPTPVKAPE
jgi:alpha-tubulin suppressor-like RCC1 family protein